MPTQSTYCGLGQYAADRFAAVFGTVSAFELARRVVDTERAG